MFQTRIPIYKPEFKDDRLKSVVEIKELVMNCISSEDISSEEIALFKKEPYCGSILNVPDENGSTKKQTYLAHTILCKDGIITLENAEHINNLELKNHHKDVVNRYGAESEMCLGVSAEIMDKIGNINQLGPPGVYLDGYSP